MKCERWFNCYKSNVRQTHYRLEVTGKQSAQQVLKNEASWYAVDVQAQRQGVKVSPKRIKPNMTLVFLVGKTPKHGELSAMHAVRSS